MPGGVKICNKPGKMDASCRDWLVNASTMRQAVTMPQIRICGRTLKLYKHGRKHKPCLTSKARTGEKGSSYSDLMVAAAGKCCLGNSAFYREEILAF